jgi:hypothetical protein
LVRDSKLKCLGKIRKDGIPVRSLTSEKSSVDFLRRGATLAVLKSKGTQPVFRDVRNRRRSPNLINRRRGWRIKEEEKVEKSFLGLEAEA